MSKTNAVRRRAWLFSICAWCACIVGALGALGAFESRAYAEAISFVPPGPPVAPSFRRTPAPYRACSFSDSLCVHGAEREAVLRVLHVAEGALFGITRGLRLPPPDPGYDSGAFDIYLSDATRDDWETSFDERKLESATDRASSYARIDGRLRSSCAIDFAVTNALLRGSLFRAAPATDEATSLAEVTSLAALLVPCALDRIAQDVAAFQDAPSRPISDHISGEGESAQVRSAARGASLFYSWLDWSYAREPGAMALGLWALRPTFTPFGSASFVGKPDAFDVLRESFKNALFSDSTVDDLYLDFAVSRAFIGSADDGQHFPESRTFGEAGKLHHDWDIDWPSKARRLAPRTPLLPTGSSTIAIRTAGAPTNASLRVEAEWEQHAKMKWSVVRVDAGGKELGRIDLRSPDRATNAQASVVDLRGTDHVLIVGVNTGDFAHPFDPDDREPEPHSWLVTVAAE